MGWSVCSGEAVSYKMMDWAEGSYRGVDMVMKKIWEMKVEIE